MGWTSSYEWQQKKDVVAHCNEWGEKVEVLQYSVRGNSLWQLCQYKEGGAVGQCFVALYLLSKHGDRWAYKDLDDTCGPYYYNCPLSYIEKTVSSGRALSQSTVEWHEKVRRYHQEKAIQQRKLKNLKAGVKVKYGDTIYQLTDNLGRKGWLAQSQTDNLTYRMMAKQVSSAQILAG